MFQFSTTTWSRIDCAIDRQNSCEIGYAWNIVWYGQFVTNWCVVLSKCRFILNNFHRDAWHNLWLSGDTGTLTANKMALPIEVLAEMVSYSYFCWKKYDCSWVTKPWSRYYCNMSRIQPRLIRCHWSFDPQWVKISGHTEQLGPCQQSTLKTQNSGCVLYWRFGAKWWSEKIQAGDSQKSGCDLYWRCAYIRNKMVMKNDNCDDNDNGERIVMMVIPLCWVIDGKILQIWSRATYITNTNNMIPLKIYFIFKSSDVLGSNELTHKQLGMHGCVLSTVSADALVLKH